MLFRSGRLDNVPFLKSTVPSDLDPLASGRLDGHSQLETTAIYTNLDPLTSGRLDLSELRQETDSDI